MAGAGSPQVVATAEGRARRPQVDRAARTASRWSTSSSSSSPPRRNGRWTTSATSSSRCTRIARGSAPRWQPSAELPLVDPVRLSVRALDAFLPCSTTTRCTPSRSTRAPPRPWRRSSRPAGRARRPASPPPAASAPHRRRAAPRVGFEVLHDEPTDVVLGASGRPWTPVEASGRSPPRGPGRCASRSTSAPCPRGTVAACSRPRRGSPPSTSRRGARSAGTGAWSGRSPR